MKLSLLLLLLPLHSFAQYGGPGMQMQQNQQSRQDFNRMTNQRTMDFQRSQLERGMNRAGGARRTGGPLTMAQAQALQQQAEQAASDKLTHLAQQQQQQRLAHPAATPQLAAAQQKADDKQLTLLAVKNYGDVFLPGQFMNALAGQQLSPKGRQTLQNANAALLPNNVWKDQDRAKTTASIKAYGDSLTSLITNLLGFSLTAPPAMPAPFSVSGLQEQLARDAFDPQAASQLIREAALSERLAAGTGLAQAAANFSALAAAATTPAQPAEVKQQHKAIEQSLNAVNKEMQRYNDRIMASKQVNAAEKALRKTTAAYVAKNGK